MTRLTRLTLWALGKRIKEANDSSSGAEVESIIFRAARVSSSLAFTVRQELEFAIYLSSVTVVDRPPLLDPWISRFTTWDRSSNSLPTCSDLHTTLSPTEDVGVRYPNWSNARDQSCPCSIPMVHFRERTCWPYSGFMEIWRLNKYCLSYILRRCLKVMVVPSGGAWVLRSIVW